MSWLFFHREYKLLIDSCFLNMMKRMAYLVTIGCTHLLAFYANILFLFIILNFEFMIINI